jgi:hypothetical protein
VFAVASLWSGVVAAYLVPSLPPSTAILGVASLVYLAAFLSTAVAAGAVQHDVVQ